MNRLGFVLALLLALVLQPQAVWAQETRKLCKNLIKRAEETVEEIKKTEKTGPLSAGLPAVSATTKTNATGGLDKDAPNARAITRRPSPTPRVVAMWRVGGLHHRYGWREAA